MPHIISFGLSVYDIVKHFFKRNSMIENCITPKVLGLFLVHIIYCDACHDLIPAETWMWYANICVCRLCNGVWCMEIGNDLCCSNEEEKCKKQKSEHASLFPFGLAIQNARWCFKPRNVISLCKPRKQAKTSKNRTWNLLILKVAIKNQLN